MLLKKITNVLASFSGLNLLHLMQLISRGFSSETVEVSFTRHLYNLQKNKVLNFVERKGEERRMSKSNTCCVVVMIVVSMLMLTISPVRANPTLVYMTPADNTFYTSTTPVGSTFTVTIWVGDVQCLYGWQIQVNYDSTMLNCISASFLTSSDPQYVFRQHPTTHLGPLYHVGNVQLAEALLGSGSSFNGSGKLCTIQFQITRAPLSGQLSCTLELSRTNCLLSDPTATPITIHSYYDGNYCYIQGSSLGNLVANSIEPNQVVWGANLIRGKKTDFRLSYTSTFPSPIDADIRLDAPDFSPNTYTFTHTFAPGTNTFIVGVEDDYSPLFEVTSSSSARYRFTIDPANAISETSKADNVYPRTGYESRQVVITRRLRVLFVPIRFENEPLGIDSTAFSEHLTESVKYLKATFPIDEDKISSTSSYSIPRLEGIKPTTQDGADIAIVTILQDLSGLAGNTCERVIGVVRENWFYDLPGTKHDNYLGICLPYAQYQTDKAAIVTVEFWKNTPHEIGHTYGLDDDESPFAVENVYYPEGRIEIEDDWSFMTTGLSTGCTRRMPVPVYWIMTNEYQILTSEFTSTSDPEVLLFRGTFWPNGTTTLGDFYRFPSGFPDLEEGNAGNYSIAQYDGVGNMLSNVRFNVTFTDRFSGITYDRIPLAFTIPYSNLTRTIKVLNATGDAISNKSVSLHAPMVSIT